MAKEGKKPIGKIVLGVIVVLVIVGAVFMGGNSTDSSASDARQTCRGDTAVLRSKRTARTVYHC